MELWQLAPMTVGGLSLRWIAILSNTPSKVVSSRSMAQIAQTTIACIKSFTPFGNLAFVSQAFADEHP